MKRLGLCVCLAGLVTVASAAPALPPGVTRRASVEGITEYDLSNGLRVLLFPDPSKTTITVNMTYLVGSRYESYGETGMAHLLEHLLFKPSSRHKNIPEELNTHGARFNGSTSWDRTNYFETFEGTDANLNWALDLESDRMLNAAVDRKDLDSEMTVVRNEFERGENNPSYVLFQRVMAAAYLFHNYGKPPIGSRSDIEHVPIDRLQAFYHRYYQPDNAVLTIAGHIDEEKTLQLVAKYFGPLPKPNRVLEGTYTEEPAQDGERVVTLRRVGDSKDVMIGLHVPALASPDGALADVLGDVFANAPSGRLYKALVETKKAGSVADWELDLPEPNMLILFAQAPKTADLEALRQSFEQVIDDMQTHPPTDEEVQRSKTKALTQIELTLRNSEQLGLELSEYIAAGDWRLAFIRRDRIKNATTAEVDQFARTYLLPSNRTVGLFIPTDSPQRAQMPPRPDVAALVKDYKSTEVIAQGEAFDPSPENIDKRTIRGEVQPGIKLALLPKKTRGEVVALNFHLHFGNVENLKGHDLAGTVTAAMLSRGTASHTRQQLTDELNRLKAQVRIGGDATGANVSVETVKENVPAVMALIAEELRSPSFPESEFATLKEQWTTALEAQRSEPEVIASEKIQQHLNPYPPGDVRYVMSMDEEVAGLKTLKLDEVKRFYDQFYGADHAELTAVGDFDAEKLQTDTSKLFADWRSKQPYARVVSNYKEVAAINDKVQTPDKANAVLMAAQPVKMSDSDPDYPALLIANYMLGGGGMHSRLTDRIRVKDGLSYGVTSHLSVPMEEDAATLIVNAISAPQNTAHVESDLKEELDRALHSGFTEDELAQAKSGWLQSRQVGRAHDNELAMKLATLTRFNRTMAWEAAIESKVAALKPEDVNAALRKYIDPAKISIIEAGDFAKAAGGGSAGGASVR